MITAIACRRIHNAFGFALFCLVSADTFAQTPAPPSAPTLPSIATDRPTFSDCAFLVPTGHWQFEAGTTANTISGSTSNTYGELITRYGISSRIEFRIANVTWTHAPGESDGLQDPQAGFKFWLQTGSSKRPDLAAEVVTTIPVGGSSFTVNRSQPTAKLLWNQQVDANTSIAGNFVASDLGPTGSRFTQYAASTFLTRTLTLKLSLFGEVFRVDPYTYAGSSASFYDAGVTYLINDNLQLDARFGAGFDPQTNGRTVGAGISYRY